jgi:hypothetical protein
MASWTDAIPKFDPYVSQLPVQAMVEVGMQKQKMYEQGVQKIQGYIDKVGGLDVIRDVDKNHLQSKLNELGDNLTMVAAGDFSNFQLVNTVGSMASQIEKDPDVQNAVASTAWYRKGLSEMDDARKKGKSSPSNDWLFNTEANDWLSSNDVKKTFRGKYKTYTNYKKNALEVIKALTKDSNITDDAFTIDGKGNLVIADAVVRKKLAGISPEKVQQALMVGLTPSDFEQMQIDGRYNYSNVSSDNFRNRVTSSYVDNLDFYEKQKTALQNALTKTNSGPEKMKLESQIASIDKVIGSVTKEKNDIEDSFDSGDIEGAKAKLHTYNFIQGFGKAFSFTETSQTYEASPLADMKMRREIKEMDWKKFSLEFEQKEKHFNINLELERRKIAQKDEENRIKKVEVEGYGGIPSTISQDEIPTYTLARVMGDIKTGDESLTSQTNAFLTSQGKDQNWLDDQREAWLRNPNGVDPKISTFFNSTEPLRRKIDGDKQMVLEINKKVENKFGSIDKYIPKDAKGITYYDPTGKYEFTPKDIVSFNSKIDNYRTVSSGAAGATISYDFARAKRELSDKEYKLLELTKKFTGTYATSAGSDAAPTKAVREVMGVVNNYKQTVNSKYNTIVKQIDEETAKEVTNRVMSMQAMDYGVPLASAAQKSTFGNLLVGFADIADRQTGGLPNSPGFDAGVARANAMDDNAKATFKVVEGTDKQPSMYEVTSVGKGGTTRFRITPEQKAAVFGTMFEAKPEVRAFRPYQEQIMKTGRNSTSTSAGTSSYKNAGLSNIDFPNVRMFGVGGNIEEYNGMYTIRVSGYDPISGKWVDDLPYPRNAMLTEEQVVPMMQGLSDAALFELMYGKPPSAAELKKIKDLSKKPF